ncbi:MAG: hypothetical protein JWO73_241 [Candidatus Taylorbacteria bacterium]|nr:hypothetical protein [Candidatus Taylorbacteria bacterium]
MRDGQSFGSCILYNGGSSSRVRWLLYIPNQLIENLKTEHPDRDTRDAIRRIFATIHRGSYPIWCEKYDDFCAVEFPTDTVDIAIGRFVELIMSNQSKPASIPLPRHAMPAPPLPQPAKKSWWRKWLRA